MSTTSHLFHSSDGAMNNPHNPTDKLADSTKPDASVTSSLHTGLDMLRQEGSNILRQGNEHIAAAGLMKAAGVITTPQQFRQQKIVTVINSYTTQIPGHAHLDQLGQVAVQELQRLGFTVWHANIGGAICDGIAMAHYGMKYSLPSRELIADQIETILMAHPCDGWLALGNCDKIVPAMYMAAVRMNIPFAYVSGGPMLTGSNNTDLISIFEAVGKQAAGKITQDELEQLTYSA